MYLALLLHLYQPPTQFAKVLKSITEASYRRVLNLTQKYTAAKLTLNVSGSLTEQLVRENLGDVVAKIALLSQKGQVELVGSAAYHPLLTEIPADEIRRQILLNNEINHRYFGDVYQPRGFFPPEMAVNSRVLEVVEELGFKWVIVDESALTEKLEVGSSSFQPLLKLPASSLQLLVRNTNLSVKVAFSKIRTVRELKKLTSSQQPETSYQILAMDGETFGHHRPEQLQFLEELFAAGEGKSLALRLPSERGSEESPAVRLVTLSELQQMLPAPTEVEIQESSWGPWERWKNPDNPIHKLQWELTRLAIDSVRNSEIGRQVNAKLKSQSAKLQRKAQKPVTFNFYLKPLPFDSCDLPLENLNRKERQWFKARKMLDKSLHSDQYWWASAQPCWHYQMVERGARMLRDVVLTVPDAPEADKRKAKQLYEQIITTGKKLHGECIIEA